MYLTNLNFFYKTGMFIGGIKVMDTELNKFNLVFFLGKKKSFFIINYQQFIYNIRIFLFFLYRLISLRGKILAFDDRFYIRRYLIFFLNRANQNYVTKHWIGGTLTNFRNFQTFFFQMTKGLLSIKKYYDLFIYYYGLKSMQQMPSLVIFTNPNGENVAFQETFRLGIPILSLVDMVTKNSVGVTFPVPSNTMDKKSLIIFYSLIGDSLLYGFLKPVSFFFNLFFKRLKKNRKGFFLQQQKYQKMYNNIVFYFSKNFKKFSKNLKIFNFFFFDKYFYYFQKKKIFNLRVFFSYTKKSKFLKLYFKNSFFVLWFLKKILRQKKKRRKIFKRLFRYKKRQKRYKFFKIFKKKFRKIFKKIYYFFLKKYLKKYLNLNFIILYNQYKNFYKKKELNILKKQFQYEEEHIELILDEFDELPSERKNKELKKLNKNFEEFKSVYFEKDFEYGYLNKNKKDFIEKYNYLNFYNFKNKFLFPVKKLNIVKKKNYLFQNDFNYYIITKNIFFNTNKDFYQTLNFFFNNKKKILNCLKKRRKKYIFINASKNIINTCSVIKILYSRFQND